MIISIWSHLDITECPLTKWGEGVGKSKNGFWVKILKVKAEGLLLEDGGTKFL